MTTNPSEVNDPKKKKVSETGHFKNAANFNVVYDILEEMQSLYRPSNANIQLIILDPIRSSLKIIIDELNYKLPVHKNAVAKRNHLLKKLDKLITRTLNYAKSIAISVDEKKSISSQIKKIRAGQNKKSANSISTSHMSYDNRLANFNALIQLLAAQELYNPSEVELQITNLQNLYFELKNLNDAVNYANISLITARKSRNEILYLNKNNVIQLVKEIKTYLKSLGEPAEPYYKVISSLKFINKF